MIGLLIIVIVLVLLLVSLYNRLVSLHARAENTWSEDTGWTRGLRIWIADASDADRLAFTFYRRSASAIAFSASGAITR